MAIELVHISFLDTMLYLWIQRCISLILALLLTFIFICHVIKSYSFIRVLCQTGNNLVSKQSDLSRILTHLFTCFTLFWYLLLSVNYNLNVWSIHTEYALISCNVIEIISVGLYHLAKGSLYLVLILRIKSCFEDSSYYKKLKNGIIFVCILLFLYASIAIYGDISYISGTKITIYNQQTTYCILNKLPIWTIITMALFDIIICITCLLLFNYPLQHLIRTSFDDKKFTELLQKYTVLTTIAVLFTVFVLCLQYITHIGVLILFDNLINSLCIIMMSSWYNSYYYILCYSCHKTVSKLKTNSNSKKKDITRENRSENHSNNTSNSSQCNININTSQDSASTQNNTETVDKLDTETEEFKANLEHRQNRHLDTIDFTKMILNRETDTQCKPMQQTIPNYENINSDTVETTYTFEQYENEMDIEQLKFVGCILNELDNDKVELDVIENNRVSVCSDDLPPHFVD